VPDVCFDDGAFCASLRWIAGGEIGSPSAWVDRLEKATFGGVIGGQTYGEVGGVGDVSSLQLAEGLGVPRTRRRKGGGFVRLLIGGGEAGP